VAIIGHPSKKFIKAEAYIIRREKGSFINFIKSKEIYLLIKPLRVLKEDLY